MGAQRLDIRRRCRASDWRSWTRCWPNPGGWSRRAAWRRRSPRPLPGEPGLPAPLVGHRRPRLLARQRLAALQQLDGVAVGRSDEGHVAVARRAQDGDAERRAAARRSRRCRRPRRRGGQRSGRSGRARSGPSCRSARSRRVALGAGAQEHEREAARFVLLAAQLAQAELGDEEVERGVAGRGPAAWCGGSAWRGAAYRRSAWEGGATSSSPGPTGA